MKTVGMDVSSESFTAAVFDGSRVVASKSFSLRPGWQKRFVTWCTQQEVAVGSDWVVVENTSAYSAALCCGLQETGFRLSVVNSCAFGCARRTRWMRLG
ncbi:MAG: hypothetical protein HPY54_10240 [Chthonomonadetes bacterium]|nr:hypothetical protein [Chthonomonadetes bacterium]